MMLKGALALSPIFLFLLIFIGSGVYFSLQGVEYAFYKVSPTVAIFPALLLAVGLGKRSLTANLQIFLEGVREKNIVTMCMIYLLAGAYTGVLKGIGGVDSAVHFALYLIPGDATLPGIFLIGALVSTSMGTSMGTIAAVAPIAVGISETLGIPAPLMAGAVISGAMFGDNLSMISDTTIAATQIHPCSLRDKFKVNFKIAFVPMILTVILYSLSGPMSGQEIQFDPLGHKLILSLPYFIVLVLALMGMNVFIVLTLGLILAGCVGLAFSPTYTLIAFAKDIFDGYNSMFEILILALLVGGLSEIAKDQGGIRFLIKGMEAMIQKFARKAKGSRVAEGAIAMLVSFCDICTANNTVAIILSGEATYEISKKHHIAFPRTAAMVTIFSCVFQGILPYAAQVLLAGSLAGVSPLEIIPYVYYCYILGIAALLAIYFRWPKDTPSVVFAP